MNQTKIFKRILNVKNLLISGRVKEKGDRETTVTNCVSPRFNVDAGYSKSKN
jgi:hypothetical protein